MEDYNLQTLKKILDAISKDEEPVNFEVRPARINQVINWDAIFSSSKLATAVTLYVIFMVAQLALSYAGFVFFEVENRPIVYCVSMMFNIFSSYCFPILILSSGDGIITNPFTDLRREIEYYKTFIVALGVHGIGLALSIWSTVAVFGVDTLNLLDYNYSTRETTRTDITTAIRFFQVGSFVLAVVGFLMSVFNVLITRSRLIRFLNRIDRKRSTNNEGVGAIFNQSQIPDNFYEKYLHTIGPY